LITALARKEYNPQDLCSCTMQMSCMGYGFQQDGDYSNTKFDLRPF